MIYSLNVLFLTFGSRTIGVLGVLLEAEAEDCGIGISVLMIDTVSVLSTQSLANLTPVSIFL
jgi:hypothetical protein